MKALKKHTNGITRKKNVNLARIDIYIQVDRIIQGIMNHGPHTMEQVVHPKGEKATCVLLLDTSEYLARAAEKFCHTFFNIRFIAHSDRTVSQLPQELRQLTANERIDYLFNFLSPVRVPKDILDAINIASINFHPAPPEYPGVGCASYALFDALSGGRWEYGVSAHIMEERYDSGAILKVVRFPIAKDDYCDTLFDRSLDYTLFLFYEVLRDIAVNGMPSPSGEQWARKAGTRKEFEIWMTLRPTDAEDLARRKIRAAQHSRFPGPYVEIFGERFALMPRGKGAMI